MSDDTQAADTAVDDYLGGIPDHVSGGAEATDLDDSEHSGAKSESEMDAILDSILSPDPEEQEEASDEVRQVDEQEEGVVQDDAEDEEEDVVQNDAEAYAEAFLALKEQGWEQPDILQLSRADAIQISRRLSAASAPEGKVTQDGVQTPAAPAYDAVQLRRVLSDELGDDAGAAVADALDKIAATAGADPRIDSLTEATNGLRQMFLTMATTDARRQLQDRFPDLSSDGAFTRVRERMGVLASSGEYEDVVTLMQHACMIELPEGSAKPAKTRQSKRNGQPSRPGRKGSSGPMPKEHAEDEVLRRILDPQRTMTPEQIRSEVYGS